MFTIQQIVLINFGLYELKLIFIHTFDFINKMFIDLSQLSQCQNQVIIQQFEQECLLEMLTNRNLRICEIENAKEQQGSTTASSQDFTNIIEVLAFIRSIGQINSVTQSHIKVIKWLKYNQGGKLCEENEKLELLIQCVKQVDYIHCQSLLVNFVNFVEMKLLGELTVNYLKQLFEILQKNITEKRMVGLLGSGKISVLWHIIIFTFQLHLRDVGEQSLIQTALEFFTYILKECWTRQIMNNLLDAIVTGLHSTQFPICLLLLHSIHQIILGEFTTQSGSGSGSYTGICCPEILANLIADLIKTNRIAVRFSENTNIKECTHLNCGFCGVRFGELNSDKPIKSIELLYRQDSFQYKICSFCSLDYGMMTLMSCIPLATCRDQFEIRNLELTKKAMEEVLLRSKKNRKTEGLWHGCTEYNFPKHIAMNSLEESFPQEILRGVLMYLYQNNLNYGVIKILNDLIPIIMIISNTQINSLRKKTIKIISLKLSCLFQPKWQMEIFPQYRQAIIKLLNTRLYDLDQTIKLIAIEANISLYLLTLNPTIYQSLLSAAKTYSTPPLIQSFIKAISNTLNKPHSTNIIVETISVLDQFYQRQKENKLAKTIIGIACSFIGKVNKKREEFCQIFQILYHSISVQFFTRCIGFNEQIITLIQQKIKEQKDQQNLNPIKALLKFNKKTNYSQGIKKILSCLLNSINSQQKIERTYQLSQILYQILGFNFVCDKVTIGKLQNLSKYLFEEIKKCQIFEIQLLVRIIIRANNTLEQNMVISQQFSNKILIKTYQRYMELIQIGSQNQMACRIIMIMCYGIIEVQIIRAEEYTSKLQKLNEQTKPKGVAKNAPKNIGNRMNILQQTSQIYEMAADILIKSQNIALKVVLWKIMGLFWSNHPQMLIKNKLKVFQMIEKINENEQVLFCLYNTVNQILKESTNQNSIKSKESGIVLQTISIIQSIFRRTYLKVYQICKNNHSFRCKYYQIIYHLLKFGCLNHFQCNKYVIAGMCDQNNAVTSQSYLIANQLYKDQHKIMLFADHRETLQHLFRLTQDKFIQLKNVSLIFGLTHTKPKKHQKRLTPSFINKIGQMLLTDNIIERDCKFAYFLTYILVNFIQINSIELIFMSNIYHKLLNENYQPLQKQIQQFIEIKHDLNYKQLISLNKLIKKALILTLIVKRLSSLKNFPSAEEIISDPNNYDNKQFKLVEVKVIDDESTQNKQLFINQVSMHLKKEYNLLYDYDDDDEDQLEKTSHFKQSKSRNKPITKAKGRKRTIKLESKSLEQKRQKLNIQPTIINKYELRSKNKKVQLR